MVCPLRRGPGFGDTHKFARAVAEAMVEADPRHLTLEYKKADRETKIYVDVNRNAYAQHAVAPYGIRARERAPVAAPIHWDELADGKLKPDRWTVKTIGARIDSEGDPWKGMTRHARALPAPERHGARGRERVAGPVLDSSVLPTDLVGRVGRADGRDVDARERDRVSLTVPNLHADVNSRAGPRLTPCKGRLGTRSGAWSTPWARIVSTMSRSGGVVPGPGPTTGQNASPAAPAETGAAGYWHQRTAA